jgi:purine-binding chemotaxis protein CheW
MSQAERGVSRSAGALRDAFDASFAQPARTDVGEMADFISIRLGGELHAVRMTDIGGLHAGLRVTPAPTAVPQFMGLAGMRGVLTPVYDLAALLGHPATAGRWVMLASGRELAFAFDAFDRHFRIPAPDVHPARSGNAARAIAVHEGKARPAVDIPSIVGAIKLRAAAHSRKEH